MGRPFRFHCPDLALPPLQITMLAECHLPAMLLKVVYELPLLPIAYHRALTYSRFAVFRRTTAPQSTPWALPVDCVQ